MQLHILADEDTREAIVIDPGDEISRIHRRLQSQGLTSKQILVTHAHIDHVGGALKLKSLTGAPIFLNEDDLPLLQIMAEQAAWVGVPTPEPPRRTKPHRRPAVGLASYPARSCTRRVTPRAPSVSTSSPQDGPRRRYALRRQHRAHRPSRRQLRADLDSIQTRLLTLPGDTRIVPGHGPATTIGDERKTNPFLQ